MSKPHTSKVEPTPAIADDFSSAQIAEHLRGSLALLTTLEAHWPGLAALEATQRQGATKAQIARLDGPLHALFAALRPAVGEAPATAALKAKAIGIFNASLGNADEGKDPNVFEVDLLVRRIERIAAEEALVERLAAAQKLLADDIINTGNLVLDPGLKALHLAQTLAAGDEDLRRLFAPVTNALGDLTKAARLAQAEARRKVKVIPPKGDKGSGDE